MASGSPSPSPSPSAAPIEPPTIAGAFDWLQGLLFAGGLVQIVLIVLIAVVCQWLGSRVIKRVVRRMAKVPTLGRPAEDPSVSSLINQRREQRARAVGQLVRSVMTLFIWTIATLMILPVLGVNVTPLLASAGVVGVALGFGAQTLIKDYLSGIFMIIEDQFGVGDMVDLGEAVGTVEEVTLRVTRLRDQSGIVWYVRNGEILRVANRSQGWTTAIIDIPVAYDEDLGHIQEIVESTRYHGIDDPDSPLDEFSRPTFAGVESVSGEAVYIRVLAKCPPDDQTRLTRSIRGQLKDAFDEAGIRVPVLYRPPGGAGGGGSGSGPGGATTTRS